METGVRNANALWTLLWRVQGCDSLYEKRLISSKSIAMAGALQPLRRNKEPEHTRVIEERLAGEWLRMTPGACTAFTSAHKAI